MYVPDTLERLNEEAAEKQMASVNSKQERCDYCDKHASYALKVYNPADGVREVDGVYDIAMLCEEHYEEGSYLEGRFYCPDCGELFILNHSWDVVAVTLEGELYCQSCAAGHLEPDCWGEIKNQLLNGNTENWHRINNLPGKIKLWEGEYSDYPDFPGHTSMASVINEIEKNDIDDDTLVYPVITHGYQFSCVLGIFID